MQEKIRPGYKQSEIGVIPEDWSVQSLGSVVDQKAPIRYGVVQIGPHVADGVPIVPIKYVKEIASAELHRSAKSIEEKYSNSRVRGSDVLISVKGTIGRVGVVPEGFEGNIAREIARIRLRNEFSPKFVASQLESDETQRRILEAVVGTTRLEFSIAAVRSFSIAVPASLKEQTAIAEALADADARIAALEALIAKKRDLKQATMQQLLTGKTRLPGFSGEWEVKRLGEITHVKTGKRNNQDKMETGEFPFFVRSETVERIDSYSYDCEAILVPGEGNIGNIFHYINGKFDVHQRVYAITQFAENVSGKYVHLWMRMNFGAHAMQNTVKATVDSLRLPTFQNFQLLMPPTIDEQTAIAEILSDMDAELAALDAEAEKARTIKQGMMQNLLTGKVRLV